MSNPSRRRSVAAPIDGVVSTVVAREPLQDSLTSPGSREAMDIPPQGASQAGSPVEAPVDETLSRGLVDQPSNPVQRNGADEREENRIVVYEDSVGQELPQDNARALSPGDATKPLIEAASASGYPAKLQEFDNVQKTSDAGSISNTFLAEPFIVGANSQPKCPCNEEDFSKYTSEQESCSEHGVGEVKEPIADRMDCGCLSQKRSPSCWCSVKYTYIFDQLINPSFSVNPPMYTEHTASIPQYEISSQANWLINDVDENFSPHHISFRPTNESKLNSDEIYSTVSIFDTDNGNSKPLRSRSIFASDVGSSSPNPKSVSRYNTHENKQETIEPRSSHSIPKRIRFWKMVWDTILGKFPTCLNLPHDNSTHKIDQGILCIQPPVESSSYASGDLLSPDFPYVFPEWHPSLGDATAVEVSDQKPITPIPLRFELYRAPLPRERTEGVRGPGSTAVALEEVGVGPADHPTQTISDFFGAFVSPESSMIDHIGLQRRPDLLGSGSYTTKAGQILYPSGEQYDRQTLGVYDGSIRPDSNSIHSIYNKTPYVDDSSLRGGINPLGNFDVFSEFQNLNPSLYVQTATQVNILSLNPCVLAGHGVESSDILNPSIYGTDLGFTVNFNSKTYLFFGDTWVINSQGLITSCPTSPCNNDAIAYTANPPNPQGEECPKINFFQQGNSFAPLIVPGLSPLDDLDTPVSAFATKNYLYAVVNNPNPNNSLLTPLHIVRNEGNSHVFYPIGSPLHTGHPEQIVSVEIFQNKYDLTLFLSVACSTNKSSLPIQVNEISNPVFIWGRAGIYKSKKEELHKLTNIYLMVLDGDQLDSLENGSNESLKRYYYLGNDSSNNPLWGSGPNVDPAPVVFGNSDVTYLNQMSVTYNSQLDLWMMIYGGSPHEIFINEGTSELFDFYANDAGIYIRLSTKPWGPWSDPQLILDLKVPDCKTFYVPPSDINLKNPKICYSPIIGPTGEVIVPASCHSSCVGPDDMSVIPLDGNKVSGKPYAVSFWEGATYPFQQGSFQGSTFYFVMSTWNPYHVVLMKASVGLNL